MTNRVVSVLLQGLAEYAAIEGMKADNAVKQQRNEPFAYIGKDFDERANTLMYLADCARNLE
jgi:hypothetical protein